MISTNDGGCGASVGFSDGVTAEIVASAMVARERGVTWRVGVESSGPCMSTSAPMRSGPTRLGAMAVETVIAARCGCASDISTWAGAALTSSQLRLLTVASRHTHPPLYLLPPDTVIVAAD
jgi:hypothetical protein